MNLTAFDEHTFHICSQCVALCPYGDERYNYGEPCVNLTWLATRVRGAESHNMVSVYNS
jgi:hypothetical protein